MQLTEGDQERVRQWLQSRTLGSIRCFICGRNQWSLTSGSLSVGYDVQTGRIHYMDGVPMVGLVCTDCGHIVWFSTNIMRFQPQPDQTAEASQEGSNERVDDV